MLAQDRDPKELDEWLVKIAWGLLLVGLGVAWLLDTLLVRELIGVPALWAGLVLLGLNGARFFLKLRMSGFSLALGGLLILVGVGDLIGVHIPFIPLLLIIIGAALLLGALFTPGLFKHRHDDYSGNQAGRLS